LPRGKNNGKHNGLYSRYRHFVCGDVSDASWRGKIGSRLALSERSQALLSDAATVLLFSVALATTFYEGEHFAGMARVLGVAFAVFLAWRKMPLIVVIVAAAVVTALLRLAGIN
jgi:hypothetical protein